MSTNSLQIATWNVLADCYATPIGPSGQSMNWKKRKLNIQHILKLLATPSPSSSTSSSSSTPTAPPSSHDILLLQEIDHINDFYRPLLQSFGYECHYIQRPTKHDGCLIAFSRSKFQLVASEEVNFDDLTEKFHEMDIARQSFRRHNVALILCLKDCRTHSPSETPPATDTSTTTPIPSPIPTSECDRYLIISTAHIYWNPAYPEVKTGQSKYLLDRIAFFQTKLNLRCNTCSNQRNSTTTTATAATICHYCPIIVGGDFNSTPDSEQYALLTSYQPYVAKYLSSCCYCGLNTFSMNSSSTTKPDPSHYFQGCYYGGNQTKFLCDPTLSKLCRWLRVLGLNAAMHQTLPPPSAATAATTSSSSKLSKKKQKKAANGMNRIFSCLPFS